jgi:hypothetical protein
MVQPKPPCVSFWQSQHKLLLGFILDDGQIHA